MCEKSFLLRCLQNGEKIDISNDNISVMYSPVASDCGPPPSLPDASSILKNQTTAVYSCLPGYTSNNSNNAIYCKDSVWSKINLTCTGELRSLIRYPCLKTFYFVITKF